MRFIKLSNASRRPVLVNPKLITSVFVKDTGGDNIMLAVWFTGNEQASLFQPVDDSGQVLTEAAIEADIDRWGHEVLLERFESYVHSRSS